jgi:hypothetical protein
MNPILQYIFHFNPYTKQWACVDRNAYVKYMNGEASEQEVVYASSLRTLLTLFPDGPTQSSAEKEES